MIYYKAPCFLGIFIFVVYVIQKRQKSKERFYLFSSADHDFFRNSINFTLHVEVVFIEMNDENSEVCAPQVKG